MRALKIYWQVDLPLEKSSKVLYECWETRNDMTLYYQLLYLVIVLPSRTGTSLDIHPGLSTSHGSS